MTSPVDMTAWATAVQAAVTAIRKAGATSQMILVPGTPQVHPLSSFSMLTRIQEPATQQQAASHPSPAPPSQPSRTPTAALRSSVSPAFSYNTIEIYLSVSPALTTSPPPVFDVHNYFDADNSGTHAGCVSNKISNGFQPLVSWLQTNKRQALVSELGGGPTDPSCLTDICAALDFLNENSDVYLGWVGWAAGSFDASYVLTLRPLGADAGPVVSGPDVELVKQCFAAKFGGGGGNTTTGSGSNATTTGGGGGNTPTGGSGAGGGSGSSGSGSAGTGTPSSSTSVANPGQGSSQGSNQGGGQGSNQGGGQGSNQGGGQGSNPSSGSSTKPYFPANTTVASSSSSKAKGNGTCKAGTKRRSKKGKKRHAAPEANAMAVAKPIEFVAGAPVEVVVVV